MDRRRRRRRRKAFYCKSAEIVALGPCRKPTGREVVVVRASGTRRLVRSTTLTWLPASRARSLSLSLSWPTPLELQVCSCEATLEARRRRRRAARGARRGVVVLVVAPAKTPKPSTRCVKWQETRAPRWIARPSKAHARGHGTGGGDMQDRPPAPATLEGRTMDGLEK
jgi:hypothetical protein